MNRKFDSCSKLCYAAYLQAKQRRIETYTGVQNVDAYVILYIVVIYHNIQLTRIWYDLNTEISWLYTAMV